MKKLSTKLSSLARQAKTLEAKIIDGDSSSRCSPWRDSSVREAILAAKNAAAALVFSLEEATTRAQDEES